MVNKVCIKCVIEKPLIDFTKRKTSLDGYRNECKKCTNELTKQYRKKNPEKRKDSDKKYRELNLEKVRTATKKWQKDNKEKYREYDKKYRELNPEKINKKTKKYRNTNPEKVKEATNKWRRNNRDKINEYYRKLRKSDPLYKLTCNIRTMIHHAITGNGDKKCNKTEEILGCSYEFIKNYIERQWLLSHNLNEYGETWMNWGNYGKYKSGIFNYGWDIDHKIPLASNKTYEGLIKLNHYSNLQPLCSYTNRDIKKDKIVDNYIYVDTNFGSKH